MYLDQIEVKILRTLAGRGYMPATTIAETVGHHQQIVRSRLRGMARFGWVERGGWGQGLGHDWGRYRITQAGRHELAQREQLRLVV